MCCSNRDREKSVVALLTFGILVSLGVCVPMFIISYPGDECILFVSVRGEALVYGHPAGCHFISYSHCIVVIPTAIVVFVMFLCYNKRGPKDTGSISNRSLRGSLPGLSQSSYGIQTGVSSKLIIVVLTNALFVLITAIVNLSGYLVTCGELKYEHRQAKTNLAVQAFDATFVSCFGLFRETDFHINFESYDKADLSGSWRRDYDSSNRKTYGKNQFGQYQGYKHGRVQTWTGHEHLMDIPTGIELSLASSFLSAVVWLALFTILVLLRRNVKAKNRRHIVESIEDARIWASDMALSNSLPMKPINYAESANSGVSQLDAASIGKASIGKSLGSRLSSSALYAQSKHDSIHHHQQVIAASHPNGSLFMTQTGQYVQLINGVLTNVSPPGSSNAGSVQYAEVQFPGGMPINPAQPNYPQPPISPTQNVMNSPQAAMMPTQNAMMAPQNAMMAPQNAMNAMNYPQFVANQPPAPMNPPQSTVTQTENVLTQIHNAMTQPQTGMTQPQAPASLDRVSQVSQPLLPQVNHVAGHVAGHVASNQSPAPSLSHGSHLHESRSQSLVEQEEDQYQEKTTKRDQRKQLDIAERAGIKCSQF